MEEKRGSMDAATGATLVSAALAALACGLIAASAAWAGAPAGRAGTGHANVLEACPAPAPGYARRFALVRKPAAPPAAGGAARAGAQPLVAGGGAAAAGPAGGLTPEDLASAYSYVPTASGSGQTVAIVDAFEDPNIESDLATFDSQYGLPDCTTANGCFRKVGQTGSSSSLPPVDKTGWSVEIALDVETVHAVCPNCKILLVEGNSNSFASLAAATNEAVALGATEVSNSYGGPEAFFEAPEQSAYDHHGVPIVASTGDDGYYSWDFANFGKGENSEMANTPASLASVIAVGGTTLELNPDGTRKSETVWNWSGPGDKTPTKGATGGGCSTEFTAQPWQQNVTGFPASGCGTKRLDADVSAVGDPETGLDIYDSYNCGSACTGLDVGWETIGGTSLSAPLIGAMYALAGGGGGTSYPALSLYGQAADASSRFDVTQGGNGACGGESQAACSTDFLGTPPNSLGFGVIDCEGTTACNAAPGFDGPSGVGTPTGLGLFKPQLPTAVISPPGSLTAGSGASFSAAASSDPYPGGSIANASWNWGDGTSGGGVSTAHAYAAPGTYTVTLTLTDNYGVTSAATTASVGVGAAQQSSAAGGTASGGVAAGGQGTAASLARSAAGPNAKLASTALAASAGGIVTVKVTCPAGESSCTGTVTLRTLSAVSASVAGAAKKKAILTLASASFTVAGGKATSVTLHLSAKARALLARSHVLHLVATIVAHDPVGAVRTTKTTVTLSAPKAKHGKH